MTGGFIVPEILLFFSPESELLRVTVIELLRSVNAEQGQNE